MVLFYPLYVCRSDGKLKANTARGREDNEPLPEQLDQKPNSQGLCDYYRLCDVGDPKEMDWRRKLGGMLMKEIGGADTQDKNYILAAMPENYRVYEHVKCKLKDGEPDTSKASKNHAAGSNERQDAYLYGHPQGRKKRYRSPAEFFPHLMWLATDEAGDQGNCSCKFCAPEELSTDIQSKEAAKQARVQAKAKAMEQAKQQPPKPQQPPASNLDARAPAAIAKPVPPSHQPKSNQATAQAQQFANNEQVDDLTFGRYLYRTGEIAWFARGTAWGLSVIVSREIMNGQALYCVQPLSHPFQHPDKVTSQTSELRPWLAWSSPDCTHQALRPSAENQNRSFHYDTVPWQRIVSGQLGPGDAEVDGSILAAKRAETTFTPFQPLSAIQNNGEIRYNGIFIGGEKIWIGDPLRVRPGAQTDQPEVLILVLKDIVEHINPSDATRPTIVLVGDTYSYKIVQLEPYPPPADNSYLPQRVREDLARRNQITSSNEDSQKRFTSFWKLQKQSVRVQIKDIRGRWYETTLLQPLIDAKYIEKKARGESYDVCISMNGQGDCNRPAGVPAHVPGASRPAEMKTRRREDAFGASIPRELKIQYARGAEDSAQSIPAPAGGRSTAANVSASPMLQPNSQTYQTSANRSTANIASNQTLQPRPQSQQPPPQDQAAYHNNPNALKQSFSNQYSQAMPSNDAFDQFMNG